MAAMPINPTSTSLKRSPRSSVKGDLRKSEKASLNQKTTARIKNSGICDLISQSELMELAKDFRNGKIDKIEANRRFVGSVINRSFKGRLGERDREKMIENITGFFSEDQDLLQKLVANLAKL